MFDDSGDDDALFFTLQASLNSYFSFWDLNLFRLNLQWVFSAVKKFIRLAVIDEYTRMITINYDLFVIEMVLTSILFVFIWTAYFNFISNLLQTTKESLDVFDIYSLI